jgi:hypothetical protein
MQYHPEDLKIMKQNVDGLLASGCCGRNAPWAVL